MNVFVGSLDASIAFAVFDRGIGRVERERVDQLDLMVGQTY
ncbi:hypothetical protein ACI7YT_10525 [Microbacterium sp. M]